MPLLYDGPNHTGFWQTILIDVFGEAGIGNIRQQGSAQAAPVVTANEIIMDFLRKKDNPHWRVWRGRNWEHTSTGICSGCPCCYSEWDYHGLLKKERRKGISCLSLHFNIIMHTQVPVQSQADLSSQLPYNVEYKLALTNSMLVWMHKSSTALLLCIQHVELSMELELELKSRFFVRGSAICGTTFHAWL